MNEILIKSLVDSGWVDLGLAFQWQLGRETVFYFLTNEKNLDLIKKRYQLIDQKNYFNGIFGLSYKEAFLKSLFAYDSWKTCAFNKALSEFYSRNQGNIQPLKEFFDFIKTTFFIGDDATALKQIFIEAVLQQKNGKQNALAQAAWTQTKSIISDQNPLSMLLDMLDLAGCFSDQKEFLTQHQFVKALVMHDEEGKNALHQAASHVNNDAKEKYLQSSLPNLYLLIDKVIRQCIHGPFALENKYLLVDGMINSSKKFVGVLSSLVTVPTALNEVYHLFHQLGYFSTLKNRKTYISKMIEFDVIGRNIFIYAAHHFESIQLLHQQLIDLGCFEGKFATQNKRRIIDAILKQSKAVFDEEKNGKSALLEPYREKEIDAILKLLQDADCFKDESTIQQFIDAVFAVDENNFNRFFHLGAVEVKDNKLLTQLKAINFLEGPYGDLNKKNFINAVFIRNTIDDESVLYTHHWWDKFNFFIEHLSLAGCFSNAATSQAFIDAVFAKNKRGSNIISHIYESKSICLLLKKLNEAQCFATDDNKNAFLDAIKTENYSIVFHSVCHLKSYLALRQSLRAAGLSSQDIKNLLNLSIKQKYEKDEQTPYMKAIKESGDPLLVELLKKDGGCLTHEQADHIAIRWQKKINSKPENTFNRESVASKLSKPLSDDKYRIRRELTRRHSFSGFTIFNDQSKSSKLYAQDDHCHYKKPKFL